MKIALSLLSFTVAIVLRGFVVMFGWGWFIVPLGVPEIGFAHALGVSAFVATMTHQLSTTEDTKPASQQMIQGIIVNLLMLLFMYVYSLFM